MEFKVTNNFDAAVWLSNSDTIPLELWHNVASFLLEKPKLKNYYVIGASVLYCSRSMKSCRSSSSYAKEDLERMRHITMSKNEAELIKSSIMHDVVTIEQVLATYPNF